MWLDEELSVDASPENCNDTEESEASSEHSDHNFMTKTKMHLLSHKKEQVVIHVNIRSAKNTQVYRRLFLVSALVTRKTVMSKLHWFSHCAKQ